MEDLITLFVNNGSSVALLIYFIYKDNKFTENITESLTAINETLDIIKEMIGGKKKP